MDNALTRSGYKVTWAIALFDLPTKTPPQRKAANKFRHQLLDDGYLMIQLSVYARWYPNLDTANKAAAMIGDRTPPKGKVDIIFITEKQHRRIATFHGRVREQRQKINQLELF